MSVLDPSSGSSSDGELSRITQHDGSDDEIEFKYDSSAFETIEPNMNFRAEGLAQWHQVRANWTAKSKYPSTQLKEPSTPPPEEDFNMIDVEQVLVCLHRQERFPTNVPLASLVELLNVLWEEDGAM